MQYKDSDYEIFEDGRCYSNKSHKFLKPQMSQKYPTYNLTLPTGKKKVKIHRMVAETFLPIIEGKEIVNHKDGNTHNFSLDNLEWVTDKENSQHALKTGLKPISNQNAIFYTFDLEDEEWLQVKDYPNYLVSNKGRVMNQNTKRLLKPCEAKGYGYYEVNLWKNNKGKTTRIHRLVYSTFANDYELEGYVINHIDGNKLNNDFTNLEKITYQENNLHAEYIIKTHQSAKKVYQYTLQNEFIKEWDSVALATRTLNINNIGRAARENRTAGGYKWKYVK